MRKARLLLLALCGVAASCLMAEPNVLVFTRTLGWRHDSIPAGVAALRELGVEAHFAVEHTEDPTQFDDNTLQRYAAVVFLNTTGDVLNPAEQVAFERYIQAGGGFVGIHSAADTEYAWPWYGGLVGAYFRSHPNLPNVRAATVRVLDRNHPATALLPAQWPRVDEWYNYRDVYSDLTVLAEVDEQTYGGGTHGNHHPIAWFHAYDGGRAFYTGGGHTASSFAEPLFRQHLLGGLGYAMGDGAPLDPGKARSTLQPEENRFTKTVLAGGLASPMELAVAEDGRIFFTELGGRLAVYEPATGRTRTVLQLEVSRSGGTGLIGVTLDPHFADNGWLYLYHARPTEAPPIWFHLSRFTLGPDGQVDPQTEKVLLQVPVAWSGGSHHGGSLAWDAAGNLYLSTGDSTAPHPSEGFAPLDERDLPASHDLDSQRSAANTADLKGKILRIHPEPDGTYSIPPGNLFPPGTPRTRPEIYIMGVRNPYRIAVNRMTGTLYWGDIGPDAGEDTLRGPRGYDEFNQAHAAGNFGWPYFVGANRAYSHWDYATRTPGPRFDPAAPRNASPNNTGLTDLPPAQPSMIAYPYAGDPQWPELGEGGRSAMVGAFFHYDAATAASDALPAHYDGALFVFDWMRNWVKALRFDPQEQLTGIESFMASNGDFRRPIDAAFDPQGRMVMLEYGSVYGVDNPDARLVRIGYERGNRPPVAQAAIADPVASAREDARSFLTSDRRRYRQIKREIDGTAPLTVDLVGGANDPDGRDGLVYTWDFGDDTPPEDAARVAHLYTEPGTYEATLTVRDPAGAIGQDSVHITVGNVRPRLHLATPGNRTFFYDGEALDYRVEVEDDQPVDRAGIQVELRYSSSPTDGPEPLGAQLMAGSDCRACHQPGVKTVGPSLREIALRYDGQPGAREMLIDKVIAGGGGNWGEVLVMSAHPQLSRPDVGAMVDTILGLARVNEHTVALPAEGRIDFNLHGADEPLGRYTLVARYTDDGGDAFTALTGEDRLEWRPSTVPAETVDAYPGFNRWGRNLAWGAHKSHLVLRDVNLARLPGVTVVYTAPDAGEIELRQHSFNGPLIGRMRFAAAAEDATCFIPFDGPFDENGDLYFIMLHPAEPNENVITVKALRFAPLP